LVGIVGAIESGGAAVVTVSATERADLFLTAS
jgi:hypothetical protein